MKKKFQDNVFVHYIKSAKYSLEGLYMAIKEERSLHLYIICAFIVAGFSIFFKISYIDAIIVSLVMCLILALELINTSIESVVDLVTLEKKALAKRAKDTASSATFVFVVLGIILGVIIFVPYIS